MKLQEALPTAVRKAIEAGGLNGRPVLLSTSTQINMLGEAQPRWLVLTDKHLVVVAEDEDSARVLHQIVADEISDARIMPQVGSGLLQIKTDGHFEDVLRYANSDAPKFSRVAAKLGDIAAGKPVVVRPEDEKDDRVCQSCGRAVKNSETICPRCVDKRRTIMRMVGLMMPYWLYGLGLLILVFVAIGLQLVPPRLTRILLDDVLGLKTGGSTASVDERRWMLIGVVLALLGVYLVQYAVKIGSGIINAYVSARITDEMRQRMYRHLQALSIGYYDAQPIGALMSRVISDTSMLSSFVEQVATGILSNLLTLIVVGTWLFLLEPTLALWVLIPTPLVLGASWYYRRRVKPMWTHYYDAQSRVSAVLNGVLSGFRVVRAFGQEQRERERFGESSLKMKDDQRRVEVATALFGPLVQLVFMSGSILIWYLGGVRSLNGEMQAGQLVEYVAVLSLFYAPLSSLSNMSRWITQFAAASHRIFEVLDQEPEVVDSPSDVYEAEIRGELEFDHVKFGYNKHYPVLHNLSFQIKPGETIGVVGRSGAGKTTMVNLICRFYDPSGGTVKIDGIDLRQWDSSALRHQIGLVLQEPLLFRGSIADNISYGKSGASMRQIIESAKAANAHDFIMAMPEAYDSYLGESGSGLSGGQRQRLSIARALLTDPRILILDEATSSVDTEAEKEIQDALATLCRGRTTIAIAHRLTTLRNSDRIFVMDNGDLVEVGSHHKLMAKNGIYAKLVRLQTQLSKADSIDHLHAHDEPSMDTDTTEEDEPVQRTSSYKGVRFLEAGHLTIDCDSQGNTMVEIPELGGVFRMRAFRALPVSDPDRFISIGYQDEHGWIREIGVLPDLRLLPPSDRDHVEAALRLRYFLHTVRQIVRLREDLGILLWEVETDKGFREFSIGRDQSRVGLWGEHGRVVRDMDDNQYVIPDMRELDSRSRGMFNQHIYWCGYKPPKPAGDIKKSDRPLVRDYALKRGG